MSTVESRMERHYNAGDAKMKHLCDIHKKVSEFCDNNNIFMKEVDSAIELFRIMGWPQQKKHCNCEDATYTSGVFHNPTRGGNDQTPYYEYSCPTCLKKWTVYTKIKNEK